MKDEIEEGYMRVLGVRTHLSGPSIKSLTVN